MLRRCIAINKKSRENIYTLADSTTSGNYKINNKYKTRMFLEWKIFLIIAERKKFIETKFLFIDVTHGVHFYSLVVLLSLERKKIDII